MDEQRIQAGRRDNEENATKRRAAILGFSYVDTREIEESLPLLKDLISVKDMYANSMIPLQEGHELMPYQFGITSKTPEPVLTKFRESFTDKGLSVQYFLISESGFRAFMRRYDPPREQVYKDIQVSQEGDSDTLAEVSQILNSVSSDKLFDFLITQADKLVASDIHIENERTSIRIRMRIDGTLHPVAELERDRYRVIMGELASRAGISSAATTSQSGSMRKEIENEGETHLLNMRIETVPTMYGQDAVIRLFNFDASMLQLDLLGLGDRERKEIDEVVSHPRGMVLMVGPTGSGKSTTLYSMINALNSSSRKIITLEDPIEYGLDGIAQIPIDTTGGQSFADGLRSVLRLDPDVVMVGEIRDQDTARTAIQASITGHLVLSSFHASSTSAAFSRMIDLIGVNPIFSSAIRLLIAQRLVRRLVDDTKEAFTPDEATRRYIESALEGVSSDLIPVDISSDYKLYKPVTSKEHPFGYRGRVVVMEQMIVNDDIQKFIRGDVADARTELIEEAARKNGMLTLEQAGIIAVLRGETTLEEVGRVI